MSESCPLPRRPWSALLVALLPFLALVWRFDFLCDDAYITFRYARNLARGAGLVFNPGVEPPVEGYSEFLWAVLLGAGQLAGLSPLLLSRVVSVLAGVAMIHVATRLVAERGARTPVAVHGACLYLGALPPLAVWSTGGMATMPFAATVTYLFWLAWGCEEPARGWKLGLVAGAAALLRADGAWWVAAVLGPALVVGLGRGERERWRRALIGASIAAALFGLHVLWRGSTYGDWLPNTARVKVGFGAWALERGGRYLLHALLTLPGIAVALALGFTARGWRARRVGPALMLFGLTAVYVVLSGGDFMTFARFLVPALPASALLVAAGLERLEAHGRVLPASIALVAVAANLLPAWGLAATPHAWREAVGFRFNRAEALGRSELDQWRRMNAQAEEWVDLGRALALASRPGDSVVYGAVGAIGYYSELFVYDRNGLVTRSVAERPPREDRRSPGHDKTVRPEFFAAERPTFLDAFWYPGSVAQLRADPRVPFDPRFHEVIELPPEQSPRPDQLLVVLRMPE